MNTGIGRCLLIVYDGKCAPKTWGKMAGQACGAEHSSAKSASVSLGQCIGVSTSD